MEQRKTETAKQLHERSIVVDAHSDMLCDVNDIDRTVESIKKYNPDVIYRGCIRGCPKTMI